MVTRPGNVEVRVLLLGAAQGGDAFDLILEEGLSRGDETLDAGRDLRVRQAVTGSHELLGAQALTTVVQRRHVDLRPRGGSIPVIARLDEALAQLHRHVLRDRGPHAQVRTLVRDREDEVAATNTHVQALIFDPVVEVVAIEVIDESLHLEGAHDRATLNGSLALGDDFRRVLVGWIHGEALLQVRQRALLLVLPVQGRADAVVPARIRHAFSLDAAQ